MARDGAGPAGPGIEVRRPRAASPALAAGLLADDRIVRVDDQELASDLDTLTLQNAIRAHEPGQGVRLDVLRGESDRLDVELTRPNGLKLRAGSDSGARGNKPDISAYRF